MEAGRVLVSEEEIAEKLAELGAQITADYQGKELLVVGVLKGAFIVMADLARHIDLPVEFDFMAVSSYGAATKTSGVVRCGSSRISTRRSPAGTCSSSRTSSTPA